VLDEAQAIKNPAARQTRNVKELRAETRLALTGTPIENRLGDLWSIFDFINPGLLGGAKPFADFTRRLAARPHNPYGPLRELVRMEFRTLERKSMSVTESPKTYGRVSVIRSPPDPVRGTRCSPAESFARLPKIRSSESFRIIRSPAFVRTVFPFTSWIASLS
jgi:hypothetical protein